MSFMAVLTDSSEVWVNDVHWIVLATTRGDCIVTALAKVSVGAPGVVTVTLSICTVPAVCPVPVLGLWPKMKYMEASVHVTETETEVNVDTFRPSALVNVCPKLPPVCCQAR